MRVALGGVFTKKFAAQYKSKSTYQERIAGNLSFAD